MSVASKSVLIAARSQQAKVITAALRRRGYHLQPTLQAAYLGVDLAAGRRAARATRRGRVVKAAGRHRKISRWARASRQYAVTATLEKVAGQTVAHYGHQIHGMFGAELLALRRRLGAVCGSNRRGALLNYRARPEGTTAGPSGASESRMSKRMAQALDFQRRYQIISSPGVAQYRGQDAGAR